MGQLAHFSFENDFNKRKWAKYAGWFNETTTTTNDE